jgi:hypothetical protein
MALQTTVPLTLALLRRRVLVIAYENANVNFNGVVVDDYINDAQTEFVTEGGGTAGGLEDLWFFQTVVGTRIYPLPYGFISAKLVLYNDLPLQYDRLLAQDFYSQGNSDVDRYCFWGNGAQRYIYLGPMPTANVYTVQMFYYRMPTTMVNDFDVPDVPPWFAHYLADGAAVKLIRADIGGDSSKFEERFERGKMEYQKWRIYGGMSGGEPKNVANSAGY